MFSWPSHLPPGLSRVPIWILYHFVVITILLSVASTKDLCESQTDFGNLIHTIGVVNGSLWAIAKDKNWTVYELKPCTSNDTLSHCMQVFDGVSLGTKWPKLAEAVKDAANTTDFDFAIDNSVIMDSSDFGSTVLAMKSSLFSVNDGNGNFGYNFSTSATLTVVDSSPKDHVYIPSDGKDIAYSLYESGKKIQVLVMSKSPSIGNCLIEENPKFIKKICNFSSTEVQLMNSTDPCEAMQWTVLKGVLYRKQYYFFTPGKVYIFSDQANTTRTKVLTVSYGDFLECIKPTTQPPSTLSTRNVTKSPVTKVIITTNMTITSTEVSSTTRTVVIVILCIALLVILIVAGYCFWAEKYKGKVVPEAAILSKQPQSQISSSVASSTSKITSSKVHSQAKSAKNPKTAKPKQTPSQSGPRLGYAAEVQLFKKAAKAKKAKELQKPNSMKAYRNLKVKSLDGFNSSSSSSSRSKAKKK